MSTNPRTYQEYHGAYITLLKSLAVATLPIRHGPFTRGDASSFRRSFYRLRDSLRISLRSIDEPNSYPSKLYDQVSVLSAKIEPVDKDYYVVFDLDPIVKTVDRLDPANAQVRQLARANFIAAQRIPPLATPISTPIFSDEEMEERLDEMSKRNS